MILIDLFSDLILSLFLFFSDESLESGEQVAETEAGKKLKFGAQQGKNALNIAKQKVS